MEIENDVNNDILKNTMVIQESYPELSKYLVEMPVTIPYEADPEITVQSLKDYNESLNTFLAKYSKIHSNNKK